jgi:hypothetical protein
VHIALTGKANEVYVTYSTPTNVTGTVEWGTSASALSTNVTTVVTHFTDDSYSAYIHDGHLTGLPADSRVYYRVGSDADGWSATFSFSTKTKNITYAVYGDLGYVNDNSIAQLTAEIHDDVFQQVLHVGDFAYNFQDSNGTVGDNFMNQIQPVAAAAPYMITAGNHEAYNNFTEYKHRFDGVTRGLASNSGSPTNLWYSWNSEFTHFVVIDTEMYNYSADPVQQSNAIKWLTADLEAANKQRDQYPWIIMLGHKASWMDTTVWTDFDSLSHQYGVDIYFCGHQHNYDRMYPFHDSAGQSFASTPNTYTDPKYLIQIVAGSPGNKELISTGLGPSAWRAYNSLTYGYGHLTVFNATHLYWEWEETATAIEDIRNRAVLLKDHLWVIQHNHGMRS